MRWSIDADPLEVLHTTLVELVEKQVSSLTIPVKKSHEPYMDADSLSFGSLREDRPPPAQGSLPLCIRACSREKVLWA